ncbi:hypothetical protein LJ707_15340 [Mucilaginibacter sp. UR6-1]|uniref:DUF7935 family protein n=1 Tax=Mucilaginibacter sp. UR6-1 TaxID=1435643 RepID=UPI001E61E0C1|nr:hypothetical protein [Mucilaginibacter sp. UR6-1]MCC8410314.1 hypothetical protein [Mucilaginibacter sp. UR6-1]
MNLYPLLIDVLKTTLAGAGVVWVAFYLLKPYLDRFEQILTASKAKPAIDPSLMLKLQAYERIVLVIDRINPANMFVRLGAASFQANELHHLVITEIRNEYQHNVTQQVYVSEAVWEILTKLKNDTINIMNEAVRLQPEGARGVDLAKTILQQLSLMQPDPYAAAATIIRTEAHKLMG